MTIVLYDTKISIKDYYNFNDTLKVEILLLAEKHNLKRDCDHFFGKKSDLYEFLYELNGIYGISIR